MGGFYTFDDGTLTGLVRQGSHVRAPKTSNKLAGKVSVPAAVAPQI